jgi:predicted metalloprotease with PDZ domain
MKIAQPIFASIVAACAALMFAAEASRADCGEIVAQAVMPPSDAYDVTFGATSTIVHVEADVTSASGVFFMARGFKDGVRSDHVSNLKILSGTAPMSFRYNEAESKWLVTDKNTHRLHLSYDVDLSYLNTLPDWAELQYGKRYEANLYLVTGDIFVIPDSMESQAPAIVTIHVPSAVNILAPWNPAGAPNTYESTDASLAGNTLALGDPSTFRFNSGGLNVTIAFIGGADQYRSDVAAVAQYSLERYAQLFGSTPRTPYLLTIVLGDEDGQSYDSSSSVRAKGPLVRQNRVIWANGVAHELFHLWNGRTMLSNDPRLKLFIEGFTEYYANRTLLRGNFISPAEFWEIAARHLGSYTYFWYSPNYNIALLDAGTHTTKNRFGVYDGGWTLALCLDLQIREATDGKETLDDIMRTMWSHYGSAATPYSYDDLVSAVGATFGTDYAPFFKRYVSGTDFLPFSDDLSSIGVNTYSEDFDGYTFIDVSPANATERARLNDYLTR